jgi:HlyD family secretion protein
MKKILDYIKKHKIISGVILIVIILGGYFWYKNSNTNTGTVQYITQDAVKETISQTITGTGQVSTSNQLDLKPQTDGRIIKLNIQQNQKVKAGQTLAIMDQQTAANSLAQAQANFATAQANYDKLLAGATANSIQAQKLNIQSAQSALDQAKKSFNNTATSQQQLVDRALSTLLNSGLSAQPSNADSTATVTISGNYLGTEKGSFIISLYQTGNGTYYSVSGLSDESGAVNRGIAQPIGKGLYITFSTTGTLYDYTTWTMDVPNTQGSSYLSNANSYNSAVQNQEQALDQAQNSIDSAQNNLDKANLSLENLMTPPTDTDIASSKAQITSARAQVLNAQTTYDSTVLKAPFDGIIASVNYSAGDKITAGTAVATVITDKQIAKISLNEVDVAKIKLEDKAILAFDAIDGLEMTGKVGQIDTLGTVSQGVVSYNVQIYLDTNNDQIKPGMSVSANIITAVSADTLGVPNSAVKSGNSGYYVQMLDAKSQPYNVNVTVGISNDTDTEILTGLKEGDKVITKTVNPNAKTTTTTTSGAAIPGLGGGGFGGR